MKILIIQETDWLKRYPAQQHHLAEMMSLRGHEVRAIDYELLWRTDSRQDLRARRTVLNNVTKIHKQADVTLIRPGFVRLPGLDYLSMLLSHRSEIRRQIREFGPDVIVGFGILNSYSAIRAVSKTPIPFLYYWLDVLHLLIPARPFRRLGKMIESATLKRSDRVLAINEVLRDLVVSMGAPPQRTHVVRAGIDLNQFDTGIDGRAVRKSYGLDEHDWVLFFMGFLYQFSGLREVALKMAGADNSRLKLLIVGEGDAYADLQALRREYGLQDRVILAGKKPYDQIPSLIAAADICLLPAYPWEPIMQDIVPIKLYEYMAMNKPVIASRLPGVMKEFGEDNGMVYIDRPEDAVAQALDLLQNGLAKDLGSKAREFVERNSWDKITDTFERILQEAIKEKKQ